MHLIAHKYKARGVVVYTSGKQTGNEYDYPIIRDCLKKLCSTHWLEHHKS